VPAQPQSINGARAHQIRSLTLYPARQRAPPERLARFAAFVPYLVSQT
jgi:hypothetical protein